MLFRSEIYACGVKHHQGRDSGTKVDEEVLILLRAFHDLQPPNGPALSCRPQPSLPGVDGVFRAMAPRVCALSAGVV